MSEPDSAIARALAWLRQTWDQAPPMLRQRWPWFIAGGALVGFLVVIALRPFAPEGAGDQPTATQVEGRAGAASEAEADGEGEGQAEQGKTPVQPPLDPKATPVDAGPPLSPNVKLTFRTFPPRRASVHWGGKRLGFIDRGRPLIIERPRDSGPVDVIVRATGFVPVHTRAYTFTDSNIDVKITPLEKKDTLYGFKAPIVDAGVPFPAEAPDLR